VSWPLQYLASTVWTRRVSMKAHGAQVDIVCVLSVCKRVSMRCPTPGGITELLPRVPELFFSPPRLWEKLQASFTADVSAGADHAEIRCRMCFSELIAPITWRRAAPAGHDRVLHSIGIPLRELYGLSETTGIVSMASHPRRLAAP
jgi:long-subunit acyl-CoA synthetase (AMP-forming)